MKILFSKKFAKQLKKIKDWNTKSKIVKALKQLKNKPDSGKPLSYSLKGFRSIRVGHFSIAYRIEKNRIVINCFDHRKRIYKR